MSANLPADAKGIYVIAATPFHDDGRIDFDSIDRLVDFYLECGVHGMTVLGVMGEFQKLSESETIDVAARFIAARRGPASRPSSASAIPARRSSPRSRAASMEAGAAGVMVMPIPGLRTDEAVLGYMRGVLKELGPSIPVCVQDYPQLTGVFFSAGCFLQMVDEFPQIAMFKHEESPGLRKLSAIRRACDGKARRYYADPVRQRRHPPAAGISPRRRRRA